MGTEIKTLPTPLRSLIARYADRIRPEEDDYDDENEGLAIARLRTVKARCPYLPWKPVRVWFLGQFHAAVFRGHLQFVKLLHELFGLTKEDVVSEKNRALRDGASQGWLDLLKWLQATFQLKQEDVADDLLNLHSQTRSDNGPALLRILTAGNIPAIEWLIYTFHLRGATDEHQFLRRPLVFEQYLRIAFDTAVKRDNLQLAKWIHSNCTLHKEDIYYFFRLRDNNETLKWVRATFAEPEWGDRAYQRGPAHLR